MIESKIGLLRTQISKLENPNFNLDGWKGSTTIILERIFGAKYSGIMLIDKIQNKVKDLRHLTGDYINNIEQCKQEGKEIIEASITELETIGLPEKKEKSVEGLNISLIQNQTVNISFILSALEDELTKIQLEEVKKLIETDESKSVKRKKIIEKISGFGKDVASNVLANILLNPSMWG
ncbi:hypothetical protein EO244_16485 [Ancylomarina salipaludis]|uniref:Uncharacterized protein n=1 Tax=Ancylomarina salipaludis TaxID=2501299 RepID=A0A4V1MZQ1_9BACT|nr:hypothetical protein [Ancylomarina salipaludis]RXQ87404.1 hypothetical protein EO244_16485 [Ancylomarina salipaludis]